MFSNKIVYTRDIFSKCRLAEPSIIIESANVNLKIMLMNGKTDDFCTIGRVLFFVFDGIVQFTSFDFREAIPFAYQSFGITLLIT